MRNNQTGDLGSLQIELLKLLWAKGEATVAELVAAWTGPKVPAYVTILTVLRRLERRGYLAHEIRGRAFVYRPIRAEAAVKSQLIGEMTRRVFGSPVALVEQLLANGVEPLDRARIAQLALA